MKPARIALMYGLGGAAVEWWNNGERLFQARLQALRADVILVNWNERQKVYDFLRDFAGFRALCGDSLGAGSAAQYAGDQSGTIDFVGGFQPSMDDSRTVQGKITVPANVARAHCIYDPYWIDTLGLGQAEYVAESPKTILLVTQHRGAHPDDWGYSQDMIFNEIKGLMS